ncbi:MAG: sugar transferase [Bacteroidetes bacterium]|nr:sugar transferase [Bacteroidota bacterium]
MDILLIELSYLLAFNIRFYGTFPAFSLEKSFYFWLAPITWFWFHAQGMYMKTKKSWGQQFYDLIRALGLTVVASIAFTVLFLSHSFVFPRTVLAIAFVVQLLFLMSWRYFIWRFFREQKKPNAIVIGNWAEVTEVASKLENDPTYKVRGLVLTDQEGGQISNQFPVIGKLPDFQWLIEKIAFDAVFICPAVHSEEKRWILSLCFKENKTVLVVPNLYEIFLNNAKVGQVDDLPLFEVGEISLPENLDFVKRVTDILFSILGIIVSMPLMFIAAILIKIENPSGPIFYKQERLGKGSKPFKLMKFRTMVPDAELKTGPIFATKNDPRITQVGKLLRLTRLDELPQFFNVLKGEMSLVGPRPERPFFVEKFAKEIPEYPYRLRLKAGITGLAQVAGKYDTAVGNKLKYDLLYARSYSLMNDFRILFKTVGVMFTKEKAQ